MPMTRKKPRGNNARAHRKKDGKTMKIGQLFVAFLLAAGVTLAAGCGEKAGKTVDSPTEVFKKIFAAMKSADFDAGEKFVSEDFKWENEEAIAELRRSEAKKREYFEALAKVKIERVSEMIDGDLAAVKVVVSDSGEKGEVSFGFKRIGGAWKMLGEREGRAVVKQLSQKGASPDAVVREYIGNPSLRVCVMLCGGVKKRELAAAAAEMENGVGAKAIDDFWAKEIRELAADGEGDRKEPKDESSTAKGCLDLSECTDTVELDTVDGDLAAVKVRRLMDGKRRKGRMYLQKFDGEWKIVWKYEYDRAKAAMEGR